MEIPTTSTNTKNLEMHEPSRDGSNAYSEAIERIAASPLRSLLSCKDNANKFNFNPPSKDSQNISLLEVTGF